MINLQILQYQCFIVQKYSVSCTNVPYRAGTINHTLKTETANITVSPYMDSTINHEMMDEMAKIVSSLFLFAMWTP